MARILNFPTGQVSDSVGAALDAVLQAYDRRRDTVAIAFQLANLTDKRLATILARTEAGDVEALEEFLRHDAEAFDGLVEMLMRVLGRVQATKEGA
jgi:hypothetical protein